MMAPRASPVLGDGRITAPGLYDLPADDYHADPCPVPSLSSGCAKALVRQSPVHAMASHRRLAKIPIREDKTSFDIGTAAHAMLLHEDRKIFVHDGDSWRGKAAELRDEARERGETPLLAEQYERTKVMVDLCRAQLAEHEANEAFVGGLAERTIIWREDDVWLRIKPDWMPAKIRPGAIIYDYKSTAASAHPDAWGSRTLWGIGADFGAAFYLRGLREHFGINDIRYRFVVQEQKPPHAICVIEIMPMSLESAGREVERSIQMWRQCLRLDSWPGYPTRVCHVEMPGWLENAREEREARDPIRPDMIEAAIEWQRPLEEVF